eukprot:jgi/Psemu1/38729/gm1.38729_g
MTTRSTQAGKPEHSPCKTRSHFKVKTEDTHHLKMNINFYYDKDVNESHLEIYDHAQEHEDNYFHDHHNQLDAPLTQEYDNEEENDDDCYHQKSSQLLTTTADGSSTLYNRPCTLHPNHSFSSPPYLILCNSGSKTIWFSHHALPTSIVLTITTPISGVTMAGEFNSTQQILLQHFTLPELDPDLTLPFLDAFVFQAPACSCYNIILGRDVLCHFKIVLNFHENLIGQTHNPTTLALQIHTLQINTLHQKQPNKSFAMADSQAEEKTRERCWSLKEDDINTAAVDFTFPEPLTTMSKFKEFDECFQEYLRHKQGSDTYADWTKYSICCKIQSGSHWTKDNNMLWGILFKLVRAGLGWSYIQGFGSKGGGAQQGVGRKAYFALYSQAYELTNVHLFIKEKRAFLQTSTYTGDTKYYSFDKLKRKWYNAKEFLLRHNSFSQKDQFVTDFCHSISDPRLDIAVQLVLNNGGDMYDNFSKAVAHFTQTLGVKKIQASQKGGWMNVSAAFKGKRDTNRNNNSGSSPDNNNGSKKQKTSNTPTYTTQKAQVKSLLPAGKSSGNANISSIPSQDGDSEKGPTGY